MCSKCKNIITLNLLIMCVLAQLPLSSSTWMTIFLLAALMYGVSLNCIHLSFTICLRSMSPQGPRSASSFKCYTYMDSHTAHNAFHMLVRYHPFLTRGILCGQYRNEQIFSNSSWTGNHRWHGQEQELTARELPSLVELRHGHSDDSSALMFWAFLYWLRA